MPLRGRYYDGQTSASHDVQFDLNEEGMLQVQPEFFQPISIKEVKLSTRVGSIPRRLTLPSGAAIETNDHGTLDDWLKDHNINHGIAFKLESSMKYVIGALALIALFIAWTGFYGIPMFSSIAADALPVEINNAIGDGAFESMDERFFSESALEEERRNYLTEQFAQLLPEQGEGGEMQYTLVFRQGNYIGANAFALPNGTVVITDELVQLAEHDEEIFSVLLHEIGHVEHRHSLRQVISHSGLAILTVLITGDINSAGVLIYALPNILMSTSYSRDIEWEADSYTLKRMQEVGIPLTRFADFMEKLEVYEPEMDVKEEEAIEPENPVDDQPETAVNSNNENLITSNETLDEENSQCSPPLEKDYSIDLGWLNYISTHPPTDERISRFRNGE
ncbi:MAG: M48 family metallopeptidase [Arenicellales bacterium]